MGKRATFEAKPKNGILAVAVLCVFTAFALFSSLADDRAAQALTQDHPAVAGAQTQQSAPVVPKRPFTATEWRGGKATVPFDDGKSKIFLVAQGPALLAVAFSPAEALANLAHTASTSSVVYHARGPPAAA
jgi:hypothetical protein